jgi:hypothetical protein
MSEASLSHCHKCMRVEYACECEEPGYGPSLITQIMSGEFVDTRDRPGCCPVCGGWVEGAERLYFMVRPCGCANQDRPAR